MTPFLSADLPPLPGKMPVLSQGLWEIGLLQKERLGAELVGTRPDWLGKCLGWFSPNPTMTGITYSGFTIKVIIYDLISRDYKYLKEGHQCLNSFPVLGTRWNTEQFQQGGLSSLPAILPSAPSAPSTPDVNFYNLPPATLFLSSCCVVTPSSIYLAKNEQRGISHPRTTWHRKYVFWKSQNVTMNSLRNHMIDCIGFSKACLWKKVLNTWLIHWQLGTVK